MKTARLIIMLSACATVYGCAVSDESPMTLYQRLQAEDPAIRILAARDAASQKDKKAVGLLIDRLTDPETDVRMFSHMALQKITGKDFGWRPWEPADKRYEAARRWRAWWLQQQGASPAGADPTGAAQAWMTAPDGPASQPATPPAATQPASTQPTTGGTD